jgi:hypothetical protein
MTTEFAVTFDLSDESSSRGPSYLGLFTGDTAGREPDTVPVPANTVPSQGTGLHRPVPPAVWSHTRGVQKTRG